MISETEKTLYGNMQLPLIVYSVTDGQIRAELISDGLCKAAGLDQAAFLDLLNADMYVLVHPDDKVWMNRSIDNLTQRLSSFDIIYRNASAHKRDSYHFVHAIGSWQTMFDGTNMIVIAYFDIKDPEGKLGRLFSYEDHTGSALIYRDTVTGLPNLGYLRQFANERLQLLRSCGKSPILLYCDVKELHHYNTQYGYNRGDELIQLYAELLKASFPDAMIGRGADDHFIVIDAETDDADLIRKIEGINLKAQKAAFGNTKGLHVGICKLTPNLDVVNAIDMARQAMKEISHDLNAMYRFYSPERDEQYRKEQYVLEHLDKAIENEWIQVYYQAIKRVATGKATILESLARWIDPKHGMIMPSDFIPVLSRYHLMHRLDLYMVEKVCREFGIREQAGLPLVPVTVNISAQDFDHVDVVGELNRILNQYGLHHSNIIVEITEQDIAVGTAHFRKEMERIRNNGYKLWIDDFGSAYSSLNVFSQYDVDQIKFDMALLQHLDDNNGANRRIMRAFVAICREMGVHTLAEGVETAEHLDFLKEIDCEMAQGFYFYRPMSLQNYKALSPPVTYETNEERREECDAWLENRYLDR